MKKYPAFILAIVLGFFVLGSINTMRAAGSSDAIIAEEISKEDATKNYPPPQGKTSYPEGAPAPTSTGGFFESPYSGKVYDCRKLKRGALILDKSVKKVFVRP